MKSPYIGSFGSLQDALLGVLKEVHEASEVTVRGLCTKEIHPCILTITNPLNRTLLYPKRGNNPFAALAEVMWVLGGWNTIKWLERFLPRAADFSDDGNSWRAGYGPRLRRACGITDNGENIYNVDQLEYIYETLTNDSNSRQAVCTIWNPAAECTIGESKDYPCNDLLQFLIRDDKLDVHVYVRSNDAIWGFAAINIYEWTVLQEIMAGLLKVKVGNLHYIVGSMHVYDRHFEKVEKLIKSYMPLLNSLATFSFFRKTDALLTYSELFLEIGRFLQHSFDTKAFLDDLTLYKYAPLNDIDNILKAYLHLIHNKDEHEYKAFMRKVPVTDLKLACEWWYQKNYIDNEITVEQTLRSMIGE